MLEVALVAVASVLALGLSAWVARIVPGEPAPAVDLGRVRDDAMVALGASVILFVAMALGHRRHGALTFAAWSAGACAFGALASMGARAWRERSRAASHAGLVLERGLVGLALALLTVLGAMAAHALGDPQRLAPQLPEMIVGFALGSALVSDSPMPMTVVAAMVLASYFFDANAGMLRSAPSHASALGLVLFPVAAPVLGALGAAVALMVRPERRGGTEMLALPAIAAVATAAIALLGWLWQPLALCGAVGGVMVLAPRLVRQEGPRREMAALLALAGAATASFAVARHTSLVHGGALGIATAAIAAESATAWTGAFDSVSDEDALAHRQAMALGALAVALAVLDGASLFRCTRFADAAAAPTSDVATMLAACTFGGLTPARIDVSNPLTLSCAVVGVAACAAAREEATLRGRLALVASAVGATLVVGALGHLLFGVGLECVAAATLASSLAAGLFPAACSPRTARLIGASALALGAVVG